MTRVLAVANQKGGVAKTTTVAALADAIREYTNADLAVRGVVATLYDARTNLAHQVLDEVEQRYGLAVPQPPVPKSVRVAAAPTAGRSIVSAAPSSKPAEAYRQLALLLDKDR